MEKKTKEQEMVLSKEVVGSYLRFVEEVVKDAVGDKVLSFSKGRCFAAGETVIACVNGFYEGDFEGTLLVSQVLPILRFGFDKIFVSKISDTGAQIKTEGIISGVWNVSYDGELAVSNFDIDVSKAQSLAIDDSVIKRGRRVFADSIQNVANFIAIYQDNLIIADYAKAIVKGGVPSNGDYKVFPMRLIELIDSLPEGTILKFLPSREKSIFFTDNNHAFFQIAYRYEDDAVQNVFMTLRKILKNLRKIASISDGDAVAKALGLMLSLEDSLFAEIAFKKNAVVVEGENGSVKIPCDVKETVKIGVNGKSLKVFLDGTARVDVWMHEQVVCFDAEGIKFIVASASR